MGVCGKSNRNYNTGWISLEDFIMAIQITEVRNAQSLREDNLQMYVEINHPRFGWIPYTLNPWDTDQTINNESLLDLIGVDFVVYVGPTEQTEQVP
jgi:hypothetical protein